MKKAQANSWSGSLTAYQARPARRELGVVLGGGVAQAVNVLAAAFARMLDIITSAINGVRSLANAVSGIRRLHAAQPYDDRMVRSLANAVSGIRRLHAAQPYDDRMVRSLANAVSGIRLPSLSGVPIKGGSTAGEMGMDGTRASGGQVSRGGSYLVGEKGPEVFVPGSSGRIYPNTAPIERSGGQKARPASPNKISQTINNSFTIHVPADSAALKGEVRRHLESAVKEAFRGVQGDVGLRFA